MLKGKNLFLFKNKKCISHSTSFDLILYARHVKPSQKKHSFFISYFAYLLRVMKKLKPNSDDIGREVGSTLDRMPVYYGANPERLTAIYTYV